MSFAGFQQQDFSPPPPPPQPIPVSPPQPPQIPLPQPSPEGHTPAPLPQERPAELTYPEPMPQARPGELTYPTPMPPARPGEPAAPISAPLGQLAAVRQNQMTELQNPHVRDWLIAYTKAEVGSQGKQAQTAFMETVLNRAAARGTSIQTQLAGRYYPAVTHMRANEPLTRADRDAYGQILSQLPTSNISNFSTGNASGRVGFNKGGPETSYGGERFAIEGPDMKWATAMGFGAPEEILAGP